ncbi:phage portal protein [Epilithonimonas xixisoli]|uniref:SPP1 family phage portal protein n=1 Tax=Epilithonimonas xixisoli TaxID=1476462 RepID=A0A4R8IEY5_9FLAO|nr:phage portal protein [Epilithonimonas xixisoli]TDX83964.1 SPP1 family phage portal protein [Epilithonimonas xixisoli]
MTTEQLKEITDKLRSGSELEDTISALKKTRIVDLPKVEDIKKELDPAQHKVFDTTYRKDKKVKADDGETADGGVKVVTVSGAKKEIAMKIEPVTRIALAYQEIIVNRAAAFLFGFPVDYQTESEDAKEEEVLKAVQRIIHDNKMEYFDLDMAKELLSFTEVAEMWFPVETDKEHEIYGFKTKFKLKCISFKPSKDEELYPTFDEYGDLVAFSRAYSRKVGDKSVKYFETHTAEFFYRFENTDGWKASDTYPKPNPIGKIPIVFGNKLAKDWDKVQNIIESDEDLRSNFSDTNKYHSAPTMFIKGKITGFAKKGESGKLIQGDANTEAAYLEWKAASESVKLEHSMNREDIFSLTQTPDISFNNIKDIGNLGLGAQKMLFMDAHLKVKDNMLVFGPYLQRRINIIKAYIAMFNTSMQDACDKVIIKPVVTPYILGDDKETADILSVAVNSGFMSKKSAVSNFDWVQDADKEFAQIQAEERAAQIIDNFPPAE